MAGAMTKAPRGGKKGGKTPTARGKTGTKRRVRTEGQGVPLGLAVDGAKRNDCTRTRATSERIAVARPDATPAAPAAGGAGPGRGAAVAAAQVVIAGGRARAGRGLPRPGPPGPGRATAA